MNHPSDLQRYSTGLLPASSLIAIDEHLVACAPCRDDLALPPGVDLDRAWAAVSGALDLSTQSTGTAPGSAVNARSQDDEPTEEAVPATTQLRRRQSPKWLRRPVWVAVAAAIAVLVIVGGGALMIRLLGSDEPPVITTPTPTSSPTTTLPIAPPEPGAVVIPAEVLGRGSAVIASLDTAGDTGAFPSMVIGTNGLPVIAYVDRTDSVINVMSCSTDDCSGTNTVISLGAADPWTAPALALTADGLPVVAYGAHADGVEDSFPDQIILARCATADCSTFSTNPLPIDVGEVGLASITLVIGSSGTPVVSFVDGKLNLAACADEACTKTTISAVDSFMGWGSQMTSAAVGPEGNPVIAYTSAEALKLAVCQDERCAGAPVINTLAEHPGEYTPSLAFSPEGLPVIAFIPSPGGIEGSPTAGVIACTDAVCSEFTFHEVSVGAAAGVSIAITPNGTPILVYTFRDIGIATCQDPQCAQPATLSRLDTEAGHWTSIVIGGDRLPRIAYGAGSNLKVATCSETPCLAEDRPLPPPDERGIITTTVSTADAELIGANPSLVIDRSGHPAVMYTAGQESPRPKLIRCLDAACATFTETLVDVPGFHNTLTIGPDGLPVIVHHDWERVMFTRCDDPGCTTTSTIELEASEFAYFEPVAVAWDRAGAPIVAFQNTNDYYIHVVACDDLSCSDFSSGRVESFADPDNTRWYTNTVDIVVPTDGLPVVAAGQGGEVRVAKCADRACTESRATTVEDGGLDGLTSEMILGADDLPLIAYYADGELRTAKCENASCTEYTITTIGAGVADFIASVSPSLALGRDGLPVIGFWAPGRVLQLATCHDQACSTSTVSTFGEANTFALAIGADGLPVIAYHDAPELIVAKCSGATCGSN